MPWFNDYFNFARKFCPRFEYRSGRLHCNVPVGTAISAESVVTFVRQNIYADKSSRELSVSAMSRDESNIHFLHVIYHVILLFLKPRVIYGKSSEYMIAK